jgi:glycine/D-amino acid oxidase-like deaminating enzyme/nitrite reductase/ring-hydroxylating ferredoxin subunit
MAGTRPLWQDRDEAADEPAFAPPDHDLEVDVAIVGGGIVGASTAMLLAGGDRSVALLEARRVGCGTTGSSTAKCTAFPAGTLAGLVEQVGVDDARLVADADRAALATVRGWRDEGLGVDATEVVHWAWASSEGGAAAVERERDALRALGLGPVDPEGVPAFGRVAVGVPDQLLVEPALLCRGLARAASARGVRVAEHALVTAVDPSHDHVRLELAGGATIRAGRVVLATLVPPLDRTMLFAALAYRRSHAIALELPDAFERLDGMFTCLDEHGLSFRPARTRDGAPVVVVAGHGHPLDRDEDGTHLDELERAARAQLGDAVGRRTHGWLAHDAFPHDERPFVGEVHGAPGVLVATGFGGWGLARGVAAASTLAALLDDRDAPCVDVLSAGRLGALARTSTVTEGLRTARAATMDRVHGLLEDAAGSIEPGTGTVAHVGTRLVAIARDRAGSLHAVDARCTHLGCIVRHDDERGEWQCPCHGSRFGLDGELLAGPATQPLSAVDLPQ